MRKLLTVMSALAALALAVPVQAADGTYNLNWDSCTGPIDKTVIAGQTPVNLYASVIGLDVPNSGYQVMVIFGNSTTRQVPDAWAFDAPGCQGSSFVTLNHLAPAAVVKTCPSLQGILQSLQIKDVAKVNTSAMPYDPLLLRATIANAYADGVLAPSAATRYFLANILFDHTFSVVGATTPGTECGGVEQPICFATVASSFIELSTGIEFNFGGGGNRGVTVNGSAGCPASPAQTTTWGAIKSQYRN